MKPGEEQKPEENPETIVDHHAKCLHKKVCSVLKSAFQAHLVELPEEANHH